MADNDSFPSGTEIGSTVEEAAQAFAAMRGSVEEETPPSDDTPASEDAAPAEAPESEAEGEEGAEPAEAVEASPPPPAPVVKLDDGTELTVDEVKKGYLRQADYTRKTQQVAEQRRAAEAEVEAVRAERATYAERLTQVEAIIQQQAPPRPDPALRQTDPAEYAAQQADYLAHEQRLATVQSERQRTEAQMAKDAQERHAQYLAAEREKLFEIFPEWATNREKAQADLNVLRATGLDYGFTEQELDSVGDHRAIRLLADAAELKRLKAERAKVQPKIAKAPVLQPGSTGQVAPKPATDARRALERLKKSGRVEDAAQAFAAFRESVERTG